MPTTPVGEHEPPAQSAGALGLCWCLVSNCGYGAPLGATEYAHRFGGAAGWHAAKWWLGFKVACIQASAAWSRLCGLFALTRLVLVSVGVNY